MSHPAEEGDWRGGGGWGWFDFYDEGLGGNKKRLETSSSSLVRLELIGRRERQGGQR